MKFSNLRFEILGITLLLAGCQMPSDPNGVPMNAVRVMIPPDAAAQGSEEFGSQPVTVPVGTTVAWTNRDRAPHNITSDGGGLLNSGPMAEGQSYSVIFQIRGTYRYHCANHPSKFGTIFVK